jgi:hypothetical protein
VNDDLLGYLFDALEPEETAALEKRLDEDPELRARLESLRRLTIPLSDDDNIPPPEGLAGRAVSALFCQPTSVAVPQIAPVVEWDGPAPHRWRAIDLAVASAILIVAASLALPAIAGMRGDQARVLCANQLRNVGIALHIYSQQEKGMLPPVDPCGPLNNAGSFAVALMTKELLKGPEDLLCPGANSGIVRVPTVNQFLAAMEDKTRLDAFRVYMGGSYGYTLGFRDPDRKNGFMLDSPYRPVVADRPARGDETMFTNSPNHGDRGQNVLFLDGGVRWHIIPMIGNDEIYRNRNSEVGSGLDRHDFVIGASEAVSTLDCPNPRS